MTDDGGGERPDAKWFALLSRLRLARGSRVSSASIDDKRRLEEQEVEYQKVVDKRDGPHRDTAAHRRWAKRHYCDACYKEWLRAGKPGECPVRDGDLSGGSFNMYD